MACTPGAEAQAVAGVGTQAGDFTGVLIGVTGVCVAAPCCVSSCVLADAVLLAMVAASADAGAPGSAAGEISIGTA